MSTEKPYETITDFITGNPLPNMGAEENRQTAERWLVESKGYEKKDVEIDAELSFKIGEESYRSTVDMVVQVDGKRFMVFRCVAGSLGSRHRETLAAARLLDSYQIPYSVVTDGKHAEILDTVTGALIGEGLDAIPSREEAETKIKALDLVPYPKEKITRERIIFRSYDEMRVNVLRDG